jgi:Transglutaminase-like superfamily
MRKFWELSSADRGLLLNSAILLAAYRFALSALPWHRVAGLQPRPSKLRTSPIKVERLEWAVRTASRLIPSSTCLTKALALHQLLARAGFASAIHIGVAKTRERGFEGHA